MCFAEAGRVPGFRGVELENILLLFFGAHGEKGGGDDHSEKDQCKDKIVDHWGSLLLGRLEPSWSNHGAGDQKGTSHFGKAKYN